MLLRYAPCGVTYEVYSTGSPKLFFPSLRAPFINKMCLLQVFQTLLCFVVQQHKVILLPLPNFPGLENLALLLSHSLPVLYPMYVPCQRDQSSCWSQNLTLGILLLILCLFAHKCCLRRARPTYQQVFPGVLGAISSYVNHILSLLSSYPRNESTDKLTKGDGTALVRGLS